MLTLNYAIEDVYGNRHENAVVIVSNASQRHHSEMGVSGVEGPVEERTYINATTSIGYSAVFYKDIDAMNSGKKPMVLKDSEGAEWFTFESEAPFPTGAALLLACEGNVSTVLEKLRVE